MSVTAVVGAQWGDEGKGRIVDYLATKVDVVIRFQGGDNAGHTVVNDFGTFKLHLVPSGIFNPNTICLLGTGMVINPESFLKEVAELERAGIVCEGRLFISDRAHILMPYHVLLDQAQEEAGKGIGSTKKGISFAYVSKMARTGLRFCDLPYVEERDILDRFFGECESAIKSLEDIPETYFWNELFPNLLRWKEVFSTYVIDSHRMLGKFREEGKSILLEGQLGVMRDIDYGTYPYVTSSNPISGGVCAGAGLPPNQIDTILGVVKAYSTCVGEGPFPTELKGEEGNKLREIGKEYGATTGRPRRCGWLDGVALKYSSELNGFNSIAVTKLDVLDSFPEIKICVGYEIDGKPYEGVPSSSYLYGKVIPVYETWHGWNRRTTEIRRFGYIPIEAQRYLKRISEISGVLIKYVSVGPERDQIILI
ncbi:MAG: adenylosuccinate synthase [bacterium]